MDRIRYRIILHAWVRYGMMAQWISSENKVEEKWLSGFLRVLCTSSFKTMFSLRINVETRECNRQKIQRKSTGKFHKNSLPVVFTSCNFLLMYNCSLVEIFLSTIGIAHFANRHWTPFLNIFLCLEPKLRKFYRNLVPHTTY